MAEIVVRYFAGAAEAAGAETETVEAEALGELRDTLVERHGDDFAAVLARCSMLVDGISYSASEADAARAFTAATRVDVLPPFAGG